MLSLKHTLQLASILFMALPARSPDCASKFDPAGSCEWDVAQLIASTYALSRLLQPAHERMA